jgi:hypothetical protein
LTTFSNCDLLTALPFFYKEKKNQMRYLVLQVLDAPPKPPLDNTLLHHPHLVFGEDDLVFAVVRALINDSSWAHTGSRYNFLLVDVWSEHGPTLTGSW